MVLLESSMVPLGTKAPDFNLKGIDDGMHTLESYSSSKVLVLIFMCNHCPYVKAIWDDLVSLEARISDDAQFVAINSNGANPDYPDDSFEMMKKYAEDKGQKFPYLIDEDQMVGKAYDAKCTPDFFVFDLERNLAYRGAFEGLEEAVNMLLNDEKPSTKQSVSMGCSIKWMN